MGSNEFDLQRPSATGRPAPAERISASAEADARRGAPPKADFHRRTRRRLARSASRG